MLIALYLNSSNKTPSAPKPIQIGVILRSLIWPLAVWVSLVWIQPNWAQARQILPTDLGQLHVKPLTAKKHHEETLLEVVHHLKFSHYLQQKYRLNDQLSEWVLEHYLDRLDPNRINFYASDVKRLNAYRHRLDDALRDGNVKPGFDIFNTYQKRSIERLIYSINLLEKNYHRLDFSQDEYLLKDRGELAFASTEEQMHRLWNKQLKAAILTQKFQQKTDDEIRELLIKRYRNRLSQRIQISSEDVFQLFVNSVASIYDPHTQYLSPRASDNFNINMSLSLEGIGAVLQSEDEYTKVVRLVPGGPADKSRRLKPEDKIISVAQEGKSLVDIVGLRIEKVVELIRGPKGSTVTLEIIPNQAKSDKTKTIQIKRDTVELEDRAAQADVLKLPVSNHTPNTATSSEIADSHIAIGIIKIPTFYADFKGQQAGKKNYRRTSTDVEKLIRTLKQKDIKGLVIDLRNNGGGSLQEANEVLGLFIKSGPTVQVRDSLNRVDLHRDRDRRIAYSGPLVVLVNRLSASASEIFAGAIQDYQRGLVIGSRTFGKGTVQALRPLTHGHLKFTQLKFYRVSGASNQHQGIVPDIQFPSLFDPAEVGESAEKNALSWDTIKAARFQIFADIRSYKPALKSLHDKRVAKDPDFQYLTSKVKLLRALANDKHISLNETKREKKLTQDRARELAIENQRRSSKNLDVFADIKALREHEENLAAQTEETVIQADDAELFEASRILHDFIKLSDPKTAAAYAAQAY